jgi:hypothetical protein
MNMVLEILVDKAGFYSLSEVFYMLPYPITQKDISQELKEMGASSCYPGFYPQMGAIANLLQKQINRCDEIGDLSVEIEGSNPQQSTKVRVYSTDSMDYDETFSFPALHYSS